MADRLQTRPGKTRSHPPSGTSSCLGSVTHTQSLNFSKVCSVEATDTSQQHRKPCNYPETLPCLLKLFLFWVGQDFTHRDVALEGPAHRTLMFLQPYSLLHCSQTMPRFDHKISSSWWMNWEIASSRSTKTAREIGLCFSCLKVLFWKASQANSTAKSTFKWNGPVILNFVFTAWKAFLMRLYLSGTLNGWWLPMKYILASEASLSSKPNSFLAQ